jgi:hypothetical protein
MYEYNIVRPHLSQIDFVLKWAPDVSTQTPLIFVIWTKGQNLKEELATRIYQIYQIAYV